MDNYYIWFYCVVMHGITCGLEHPIEWVVNAWRTPGMTMDTDYYKECKKYTPEFLCNMFDSIHMRAPNNAEEVLDWCNDHYKSNKFCEGFFDFLRTDIEDYICSTC